MKGTPLLWTQWLEYVKQNTRPDFKSGLLYWRIPMRGRNMNKPIGCKDSNGYIKTQIGNRATYVHSIIFFLYNGYWADLIDHNDQVRDNNKPENLIDSNHSKNALNSKIWNTNTSGAKGASITKYGNYKVTKQGKYLGTFRTAEEARGAYNKHC
jgi:hypothetical protein